MTSTGWGGVPPRLSIILHLPPVDRGGFRNQKKCVFVVIFHFFLCETSCFVSHTVQSTRYTWKTRNRQEKLNESEKNIKINDISRIAVDPRWIFRSETHRAARKTPVFTTHRGGLSNSTAHVVHRGGPSLFTGRFSIFFLFFFYFYFFFEKKWTARIFYQNATAKKYRTFFRLFDWNIATDTAKLSVKNHVFQAFLSKFQPKFGLKYPCMSKLPENIYRLREINVFCVTDVFYCDFVSSEPTRVQNRVHVNKNEDAHFSFARKRPFLRYFFEKRIPYRMVYRIPHIAVTYRTSTEK